MIYTGHLFYTLIKDFPYALLRHVAPGLCLDLGASIGQTVKAIKGPSPNSPVVAFEPYPGNWSHFESETRAFSDVRLVKKAVLDRSGETVGFAVPHIIKSEDGNWSSGFVGGSSVGYVASKGENLIDVETVAVDEVVSDHVRFMKIDIQGSEYAALCGARQLFDGPGVDMVYVEFGGDPDVLGFLTSRGYYVFEDKYIFEVSSSSDHEGWRVELEATLSTGARAVHAWPLVSYLAEDDYVRALNERKEKLNSFLQTDLLAVHESFLPQFYAAVSKALAEARS